MATRNERVVLELEDRFTSGMARAAAATTILDKSLHDLDGSSTGARTSLGDFNKEADRTAPVLTKASREIDRYSGRVRLLTEAAVALGPGLVTIGAAAVPAISAMAAGLGAAAGAVGTAALAFNGFGDALTALDEYRLEPTTDNLEKMRAALDELGPAGADFARYIQSIRPALDDLQNTARSGLFPGLQAGIEALLPLLPQVERIVGEIATTMGDLGADAGEALASDRFSEFFTYLDNEAAPILDSFARSTGNVIEGLASLMVAFNPLTQDFTSGMESMTRSFADWADGLAETDGFRDFVAYVRESGPQVVELIGALSGAFVALLQAAAPVGAVVVPAITALARAFEAIASSPIGQPLVAAAAGFIAVSRASTLASAGVARFNAAAATTGGVGLAPKLIGIAAAFGIVGNELAKLNGSKVDLSELEGDLDAIASGGGADTLDHITESIKMLGDVLPDGFELLTAFGLFGNTPRDNAAEYIRSVDQALAEMVAAGNGEKAAEVFNKIMAAATGMAEGTSFSPSMGLGKQFEAYGASLEAAAASADAGVGANERWVRSAQGAGGAARLTRTEINGLTAAMEEQRTEALAAFDAVTQYGQALADAREQAKKSNAGLDSTTEKGRENREALSQLAAAWNNQSDAVRNNVGRWREARQAFVQTATDMGVPIKKARELADSLMEIPRQRVVQVSVQAGQAFDAVSSLNFALSQLRDKTVNVSLMYRRAGIDVATGSADGGTVPKTGRPYADRHPYLLADGEEVISNRYGQADRHRSLLKAINAGRLADGGTAGQVARDLASRPRSAGEAVADIVELRREIKRLTRGIKESEQAIKRETRERDAAAEAVEASQAELDRIQGLADSLSSSVRSGLAGDPFATTRIDPWTGRPVRPASSKERVPTFDEVLGRLNASTADANAFTAATSALAAGGLTGGALEAVLRQGLGTAQMFAGLPPEMLAQYQATFDTNAAAIGNAGGAAAISRYGEEWMAAKSVLDANQAELKQQNVELQTQTRLMAQAERQRDRAEKELGKVKDALDEIRDEIKKARGAANSGARSRR